MLIPRLFSYHANRLRQQAQLDKLAPEGEVQAYAQQHDDQQVTVHEVADLTDQARERIIHNDISLSLFLS